MTMIKSDLVVDDNGRYWYAVEVRSGAAPVTGTIGVKIGGLKLRAVEFKVPVDEEDVPLRTGNVADLIDAQRYIAALDAAGAVAAGTDWPWGEYLVTVRARESATTYVADIDEHRAYTLRKHSE